MALAAVVVTVDQVTKHLAEQNLEPGRRVDVVGGLLGLRLFYNSGAAFSLGTGITPVLTAFAAVASVIMVVALWRTWSTRWALALGLLLGGALGNFSDRLLRPPSFGRGEVVDFLELPNFPIFNVADMCLVTGSVSIVALSLLGIAFNRELDEPAPAQVGDADGPTPASTDPGSRAIEENGRDA